MLLPLEDEMAREKTSIVLDASLRLKAEERALAERKATGKHRTLSDVIEDGLRLYLKTPIAREGGKR